MSKRKKFLKLLIDKEMSQTELAKKVGVSFQAVNKWISGRMNPSYRAIPKIAEALGVSVDEVIEAFKD